MIGRIYTLRHKKGGVVYVGSTTLKLKNRLYQHINNINRGCLPVSRYFRDIKRKPIIELVEEVEIDSVDELRLVEYYWIEQFYAWGFSLKNYIKKPRRPYIKPKDDDYCVVKLSKTVIEKVRANKKLTYMPIGKFFEIAAEEKLKSENK